MGLPSNMCIAAIFSFTLIAAILWTSVEAAVDEGLNLSENAEQANQANRFMNDVIGKIRTSLLTLNLILIAIFSYWFVVVRSHKYWNAKGVKTITPLPFIGNMGKMILYKQTMGKLLRDAYEQFPDEKYVGMYEGLRPSILIRDPKLITEILIRHFPEFKHRSLLMGNDRILDNMTFGCEETWEYWRKNVSPIFTSNKLKSYFPSIRRSANNLCNVISKESEGGVDTNIQFIVDKYTSQLSARCFLGMNVDTFKEPCWLMDITKDIITPTKQSMAVVSANRVLSGSGYYIRKVFNLGILSKNTVDFFVSVVKQYTNKQDTSKEGSQVTGSNLLELIADTKKNEEFIKKFDINDENLAAQVLVIFTGGFENSSKTLSYIIHVLSQHQDIQDRLYNEVSSVTEKHGELNHEALQEMKYLEMVFAESLRKYSTIEFTVRKCQVNNFNLPETDVVLEKGINVYFSISGLHNDEKYYSDPEKFDPERFSDENKHLIKSGTYMPFGLGPRFCIGIRFAQLTVKLALAELIMKFKFLPPTKIEHQTLEIDSARNLSRTPKNGVWVRIIPRNES